MAVRIARPRLRRRSVSRLRPRRRRPVPRARVRRLSPRRIRRPRARPLRPLPTRPTRPRPPRRPSPGRRPPRRPSPGRRPPRRPLYDTRPPWWWRRYPLPRPAIAVYRLPRTSAPSGAPPRLGRISPQARESLRRQGLSGGVWSRRLAGAGRRLIRFINRFHRVSGFGRVVRDYFAGPYKQAGALLIMRFARQLADRQPDFQRVMSFEPAIGLGPGGHAFRVVDITRDNLRYEFKPWSRIYPFAVRGQFLRDMTLSGSPSQVRWVFDGQRLGMRKADVVREVRRILSSERLPTREYPGFRRWLSRLDEIILVV
jgi:hypothetical protein